jgi:lysyl-tRNA synthetase class 2
MKVMGVTTLIDNVYKKLSRPKILQPTILYNYPKVLQPLARVNDADVNIVDQFQLVVNGWEIVKAYSELVDPVDQRERFVEQAKMRKEGDEEAMEVDEDYLVAMEHGMPPISGWGMGVDRVVALLTGQDNLRDVVLFPLMRPI